MGVFQSAGVILENTGVVPAAASSMNIKVKDPDYGHAALFAVNDVLWIKDGTNATWFTVTTVTDNTTYYTYACRVESGSTGNVYTAGQAIVNFGVTGEGYLLLEATGTGAPYFSVRTTSATPWTGATNLEHVRMGNLNGNWGYVADIYGVAIGKYDTNLPNITVDPTNGLRIRSYNSAEPLLQLDTSGNALLKNKLKLSGDSSAIAIGATPPTASNAGTGIWIDKTGLYTMNANNVQIKIDATTGILYAADEGMSIDDDGISASYGMAYENETNLWVSDYTDGFIYAFNMTGENLSMGFSTAPAGASDPIGIAYNNSNFWVLDIGDMFVYHFLLQEFSVNLSSPANASYSSSTKNFTCNSSSGDFGLKNITLYIWNSTGNVYNNTENRTISGVSNSTTFNTINFGYSDNYSWNCLVYDTDSKSKWGDSNFTLFVNVLNPVTTQDFPSNNSWLKSPTNVNFNCTTEGDLLDSAFLYGNFTGVYELNNTIISISSGTLNSFKINTTDGSYLWSCGTNKTTSSTVFMSQYGNYTINLDSIYPNLTVTQINTTAGSQTINFASTSQDKNSMTCKYSILNSEGNVDGLNNNVSFTCNTVKSATVSSYASYNLTVYASDLAGNENSTNQSFSVSQLSPSGGGGGGATPQKTSTVCFRVSERPELQRCIIFSKFVKVCNEKFNCILNQTSRGLIIKESIDDGVSLTSSEVNFFLSAYNKGELEVLQINNDVVNKYKLFTGILRIEGLEFSINPAKMDKFWIVLSDSVSNRITSNKEFQSIKEGL